MKSKWDSDWHEAGAQEMVIITRDSGSGISFS